VGEIISESVGGIIPERWATSAGIGTIAIRSVLSGVISTKLIAGAPSMSGERRFRREEKFALSPKLGLVLMLLLSALGLAATLLSARYDLWTPIQLEIAP
jgi:hypothetical protein